MRTKKPYIVVILTALTILFAMDCRCLFASTAPVAESAPPSCHGHTEHSEKSAPAHPDDCCGKCGIQRVGVLESTKVLKSADTMAHGFYDPYLASENASQAAGQESGFVSLIPKDQLYHLLTSAHALPRSPPAF